MNVKDLTAILDLTTVLEMLRAGWTQYAEARASDGRAMEARDPYADSYCLTGAIWAACDEWGACDEPVSKENWCRAQVVATEIISQAIRDVRDFREGDLRDSPLPYLLERRLSVSKAQWDFLLEQRTLALLPVFDLLQNWNDATERKQEEVCGLVERTLVQIQNAKA